MGSIRMPDYHTILLHQIRQTLGDSPDIAEKMRPLLQQISDTYAALYAERKLLEERVQLRTQQLMASTSRAYSFLDSLNMGFVMCDVTGDVVLTNNSVRRIFAGEHGDDNWTIDVIDALMPDVQLKKLLAECLESRRPTELKDVNLGKRALHLFIAPMLNETDKGNLEQIGAVILVEDITEQKILEHSKDEFLSIASHELRTPLTAIRGNAALIKQYYGDKLPDKDVAEMVSDIHESTVRLIDIVNDFLDVSALEQGKISLTPEQFQPQEITASVVRELQNTAAAKNITLAEDTRTANLPPVKADKHRTKQVLYNLVGNAIKFTDQGGVTVNGHSDDNFVYITVTDTGRGIPPENQRLLFHKFQQAGGGSLLTRDTTKGTGLGLYISKLIIERSGGKIELSSSEPDKGSAFIFSLPRI